MHDTSQVAVNEGPPVETDNPSQIWYAIVRSIESGDAGAITIAHDIEWSSGVEVFRAFDLDKAGTVTVLDILSFAI